MKRRGFFGTIAAALGLGVGVKATEAGEPKLTVEAIQRMMDKLPVRPVRSLQSYEGVPIYGYLTDEMQSDLIPLGDDWWAPLETVQAVKDNPPKPDTLMGLPIVWSEKQ